LRSRKASTEVVIPRVSTRSKGKSKQVEFSEDVEIREPAALEESDLTDLVEEDNITTTSPSPRRLRSREKCSDVGGQNSDTTPKQRERGRRQNLKEEGAEHVEDEDEVDELLSSPSPTPSPVRGRRTPVKRRLRPRRIQTHTPPSDGGDGDDEEEAEEDEIPGNAEEDEDVSGIGDEESEDSRDLDGDDTYVDGSTGPVLPTPRKLRNGKVVGKECREESLGEDEEQDEDETIDLEAEDVDIDLDAEGEDDEQDETDEQDEADEQDEVDEVDEPMDGDDCRFVSLLFLTLLTCPAVDLTVATQKTLLRMRRDNLVRMCETRDLDVAGTKPQLARSLLQWRDQRTHDFSSPSSTGTVRPPSTARRRGSGRRKTKSRSQSDTPPVLMRSQRVHQDEPRTPPLGENSTQVEPELELDLESLGLEDREIPPDKLTKLEKIGSGGFKDVFIGKFKGRRVAIAEFRDQLNSSRSSFLFMRISRCESPSVVDIKELKLLGGFDHPNIVRFVSIFVGNLLQQGLRVFAAWCQHTGEHARDTSHDCQRTLLEWRPFRLCSECSSSVLEKSCTYTCTLF